MIVFLVFFQMGGQFLNGFCQESDLDFGRARVFIMRFMRLDYFCFFGCRKHVVGGNAMSKNAPIYANLGVFWRISAGVN